MTTYFLTNVSERYGLNTRLAILSENDLKRFPDAEILAKTEADSWREAKIKYENDKIKR
jgi:hypothetical protein